MSESELPRDAEFDETRDLIDDLLRVHADHIGPNIFDEYDEVTNEKVENPILSEWVLLTYWTDGDGGHHYVKICSPHLAPHSRVGLLKTFAED
jgi:hypothetical protein